jgi:hypothetical protein
MRDCETHVEPVSVGLKDVEVVVPVELTLEPLSELGEHGNMHLEHQENQFN